MYGRIFGFHRLARWPKWTPASISSFTWTMATHCPPVGPARRFVSSGRSHLLVGRVILAAVPPRVKGSVRKKTARLRFARRARNASNTVSSTQIPAINHDRLSRDVTAGLAGEQQRGADQLLRLAPAADGGV